MEEMLGLFEGHVRDVLSFMSVLVEAAAGVVVALAVIEALWRSLRLLLDRVEDRDADRRAVRLRLGRGLALALELLLAADILQTAIAPTWDDIGKLAAVAAIRTALNYFLEREVQAAESQAAEAGARSDRARPARPPS